MSSRSSADSSTPFSTNASEARDIKHQNEDKRPNFSPMHMDDLEDVKWLRARSTFSIYQRILQVDVKKALGILFVLLMLGLSWSIAWAFKLRAWSDTNITPFATENLPVAWPRGPVSLLSEIYAPIKVPITQASVTGLDMKEYVVINTTWTTPLKKEVLILDVDTRSLDSETQFLHNESVPWDMLDNQGAGLLNHYMYSMIHGYDYKFFQVRANPAFGGTWSRVFSILDALPRYRFVISMDSDAIWNLPEVPIEWLLNHWNITADTSLAFAGDWDHCIAKDNGSCVNGGFIIAQQNERTTEIMRAWRDCPYGVQFPGCENWARHFSHEQKAFNEFLIPEYTRPTDIVRLPCDESDGSEGDYTGCHGVFISHFWATKLSVRIGIANTIMRSLTQRLHGYFVSHREELLEDHDMLGTSKEAR